MCLGIIGHCGCVRCVDHPMPGKLIRVEFCADQQAELTGVWTRFNPHDRKITPCAAVKFDRVLEPSSCHFKNLHDAGTTTTTAHRTSATTTASTSTQTAAPTPSFSSSAFRPINKPNNPNLTTSYYTPHPAAGPSTPPNPTTTSSTSANTPTPNPMTNTSRKRLPDGRPRTPATMRAVTAVTAADRAGEPWTHEETVKLLLLRSREVGYAQMEQYLPGRDEAACLEKLLDMAMKHGYEEYI